MDKQIYDLNKSDFDRYPVWYFPMDESVEDELSVRPLNAMNASLVHSQKIIKTDFVDSEDTHYSGYLYWCLGGSVDRLQPVLFFNENSYVNFWNGMIKPSLKNKNNEFDLSNKLPISFISEEHFGLKPILGKLIGLYYFDMQGKIQCVEQ